MSGQHNSPASLLPGKGLSVTSEPQSWDGLREQWIQCLLQSGEIRMAFEAVAVTGVHITEVATESCDLDLVAVLLLFIALCLWCCKIPNIFLPP